MRGLYLILILFCSAPAFAGSKTGRVVSIADGDTMTVLVDHQQVRVRLYGFDAPEKKQPFGTRAKQYASDLAFGKTVEVIERGHDRYRRTIGEVILPDGRNIAHEMLKAGLGWWFSKYAKNDTALAKLEAEARSARRGLWVDPAPIPPWEFRKPAQQSRRNNFSP